MGKNCQDYHFLGGKLQKFTNLGVKIEKSRVKIEKSRVKSIKFCTFWVKSFPPLLFFPTPPVLLFGRIFTYGAW